MSKDVSNQDYILKASCPASSGIVAAITGFLADHGCYISEMSQYDDPLSKTFWG